MSALTMTRDEAHRASTTARDRHLDARAEVDSLSRVIAQEDVRIAVLGRRYTCAEVMADELIVRVAAEHEAFADWQDARVLCGRKAMAR
jgi:hypothetical protein